MTDSKIIAGLQKKDEEALVALRSEYEQYCFRIAFSFLRDEGDAMECVNEVYMILWSSTEPISHLRAYLAKITRNAALQRLRRQNAKKRAGATVLLDELSECLADPANEFEGQLLRDLLNDFIKQLPQEERYVFLRRYWYGFTVDEIAKELSWHSAKVKTMLFRTRKKLKNCIAKEGYTI